VSTKKKKHDVLVLNRMAIPVHIISWKRAMTLLVKEEARAMQEDHVTYSFEDWVEFTNQVEEDRYAIIHTAKKRIAIPEIIILRKCDYLPAGGVKYSRESVFKRDNYVCAYCGQAFRESELTIDHIIPRFLKGETTWNNVISACRACNNLKANRTPEQAGMKLLFKPRKPEWLGVVKSGICHPCKSWEKFEGI